LGIVLNHIQASDDDLAMQTNVDALRRWGKAPLLCQIPYMPVITAETLDALGQQLILDGEFPFAPNSSLL
jgi:dethiobiotin synthetase